MRMVPDAMNPNAPEHQPEVASDETIIREVAERLFSEPDFEAAHVLNKRTSISVNLFPIFPGKEQAFAASLTVLRYQSS